MKDCDLGPENAALGLRPVFKFFTMRTFQPANNIYLFHQLSSPNCFSGAKFRAKCEVFYKNNFCQALLLKPLVVQSLNSTFFPPHIGADLGQAKRESRITCMRMLRTPPFSPKSGENHIWKYFPDLGLWCDFPNNNIQTTISAF